MSHHKKHVSQSEKSTGPTREITQLGLWSKWIVEFLIYAVLIVPALAFSPWHLSSFEMIKNTAFIILAMWLAVFFVIYKIESRRLPINSGQKVILILFGGWWLFKLISLWLAPNHSMSFWGGSVRQEGLTTHLFLTLWFFIVADFVTSLTQVKRWLLGLCFVAGVIALYGDLQKFGIDFSALKWDAGAYQRIASSLGNPLFLSAFFTFTLAYGLYCLKEFKNLYLRLAIGFSCLLQFLAIIFTFTSSSVLGIFGGLVFGAVIYFWPKKRSVAIIVLGAAILVVIFLGLISTQKIFKDNTPSFLSDILVTKQSNLQRVYLWQSSWQALCDKPFFGFGNENFQGGFEAHSNTKLIAPLEFNFDRAHNFIFDRLVMEGVFATLFFLAILIYSIYRGVRRFYKEGEWLYLIAATLIFALCVNFLTSFPTMMSYVMWFFSMAIIFCRPEEFKWVVRLKYREILFYAYWLMIIFAIIFTVYLFRPWRADLTVNRAIATNNALNREAYLEKAVEIWPEREYQGELYKVQKHILTQARDKGMNVYEPYKVKTKITVDRLLDEYGNYYMMQLIAADYYSIIKDEASMTAACEKALTLGPTRYEIYWYWGEYLLSFGKYDEAIAKFQAAIDIDPSQEFPKQQLEKLKQRIDELKKKAQETTEKKK